MDGNDQETVDWSDTAEGPAYPSEKGCQNYFILHLGDPQGFGINPLAFFQCKAEDPSRERAIPVDGKTPICLLQ